MESRETESRINEARDVYRGVAARGAQLFFLLNSLSKMHAFYQHSLSSFVVSLRGTLWFQANDSRGFCYSLGGCGVQRLAQPSNCNKVWSSTLDGPAGPPLPAQDVFERGIDTTPGGRRKPAPAAAGRRRTSLHDLVQSRQTQQAGRYEDVMDAARRSTSHGPPRASHMSGGRLSAMGDHHDGAPSSHRESVIGDATLASAMSRVSHAGGPRMSHAGGPRMSMQPGGHGGRHSGGPNHLGRQAEEAPAELTPEQLEARLAALLDTCTLTVFSYTQRGLFDRDKLVFTALLTTQILLKVRGQGDVCRWGCGAGQARQRRKEWRWRPCCLHTQRYLVLW